ncbi:hypothetical protein GUJ93_ZPchr0366g11344 [Zizania palustris]|uniref:Uncharacterized protein n=1 Tax=Zizania palustris TaxID=103762 RepID=A0A8J5X2R8_ZIZPA|nr:hypothetical protein GUJ93_ZPchr1380g7104 [Zizania palustris]KAG8100956.1 hypothetical protein GUJ93_ZPchr0366g11344 [Zizania palustris]
MVWGGTKGSADGEQKGGADRERKDNADGEQQGGAEREQEGRCCRGAGTAPNGSRRGAPTGNGGGAERE